MSNLKNINLEVAKYSMSCVKQVIEKENSDNCKKYKTLVKKMSTMIQKNGLISTLVFNLSNIDKPEHKLVLSQIAKWNITNPKISDLLKVDDKERDVFITAIDNTKVVKTLDNSVLINYIAFLTNMDSQEYRFITKEMMILFGWVKRFVDGMIEDDANKSEISE